MDIPTEQVVKLRDIPGEHQDVTETSQIKTLTSTATIINFGLLLLTTLKSDPVLLWMIGSLTVFDLVMKMIYTIGI